MGVCSFKRVACLILLASLTVPAHGVAGGSTRKGSSRGTGEAAAATDCDNTLVSDQILNELSAQFEEYPFDALISSNPETNLAVKFPTIVMDVNQIALHVIKKHPMRRIKDPTYPIVTHNYFPTFSAGVPETGGAAIIGQFEAVQRFVDYVELRASGQALDNALMFAGPAGTGKTEFMTITDRAIANLSSTEPEYYQWTFKFVNLEGVKELKPIIDDETGELLVKYPPDSPLTLLELAPTLKRKVVGMASGKVKSLIGYGPRPWSHLHPQVQTILMYLAANKMRTEKHGQALTEQDYVDLLRKHVRIVRNYNDPRRPGVTVDYQGEHPEPSSLFGSENPMTIWSYGKANPLSWSLDGLVMRMQGRPGTFDELFRNKGDVLNFLLKVIQSGVAEVNGAPATYLNILPIAASNDESIVNAKENGPIKALLNRFMIEPMRAHVHPVLTAETAFFMSADRRVGDIYSMRKLNDPDATLEPAQQKTVFTEPNEKGEVKGPDGRVALYYTPSDSVKILIAPHTLELLGLTVASTRLELDPKKIEKLPHKLEDLAANMDALMNPSTRMKVIRRDVQVQGAILKDLRDVMFGLREGEKGISARDAKRWLLNTLTRARNEGHTAVTPVTLDRVFGEMIVKGEFEDIGSDIAARWARIHAKIKVDFVAPALRADVQAIVGGDAGLVDKLYFEITQEILAKASRTDVDRWSDGTGESHPIDEERLKEIAKIYEALNNEPFNFAALKSYITAPGGNVYGPLKQTVEQFLLQKELSTAAMTELLDYFAGKAVSEETRVRGAQAEVALEKFGYDRYSFGQALRFIRDLQYELKKLNSARQN